MDIKKAGDWFNDADVESKEVNVVSCSSVGGYVVCLRMGDKFITAVSSQREDKRVFKSLDTVRKALCEVGVNAFTVTG